MPKARRAPPRTGVQRRSGKEPRTAAARDGDWFSHTLPRTLLHAFYWVDDGLQSYMREHASFSLPRAQSMLMVCISDGVQRQSEMAKVLRVSKQAVRQGVRELVAKRLVEIVPDPENKRSRIVRFTQAGKSVRATARRGISEVEQALAERIGTDRVWLLRQILEVPWGTPPDFSREND
jgi:DNA-binding MarR family transcriptional regulator